MAGASLGSEHISHISRTRWIIIYIITDIFISMNETDLISTIHNEIESINALFKPGQKRIIEKIYKGDELTDNEKRYLRGNLGKKIRELEYLVGSYDGSRSMDEYSFLSVLGNSYYITGFDAMKHNGFGWFYDPRTIYVINTKLKGSFKQAGKRVVLIRIKSLSGSLFQKDRETGLQFATNEQIIKDARFLDDPSLERAWWSMFRRYPRMFVKNPEKYSEPEGVGQQERRPEDYGV